MPSEPKLTAAPPHRWKAGDRARARDVPEARRRWTGLEGGWTYILRPGTEVTIHGDPEECPPNVWINAPGWPTPLAIDASSLEPDPGPWKAGDEAIDLEPIPAAVAPPDPAPPDESVLVAVAARLWQAAARDRRRVTIEIEGDVATATAREAGHRDAAGLRGEWVRAGIRTIAGFSGGLGDGPGDRWEVGP